TANCEPRTANREPLIANREKSLLVQLHPDTLDLRVVLEGMGAHFTPESALFVAAKWRGGIIHIVGVNPDRPRLKLAGDVVGLLDVACPDSGGKTVRSVVGAGDGFVDVRKFDRRQHGTEDLLTSNGHLRANIGEPRGLDEIAFSRADVGPGAAGDERRPFLLA